MKYFSLFSGIGGFELGINNFYDKLRFKNQRQKKKIGDQKGFFFECSNFSSNRFSCVGHSEIDKYAIQIYEKHFEHKNYGDITKINSKKLPAFDLLVGGFPCQAFSIAGKRLGFSDKRGALFFKIIRIIKEKQPRLLLLENVKGILSHNKGSTFFTIISALDELGYDCQWQVLNSKNFGVPQNRERVFIIGSLRGTPRPKVFPFRESNSNNLKEITQKVSDAQRIYDVYGLAKAQKALGGGLGAKTGLYAKTVRSGGQNSPFGSKQCWDKYLIDGKIRRLMPIECERLQGFPVGWTEGLSDSQRYKVLGNAVTVNVVEKIFKKLKEFDNKQK